jgi:hypothetical protein
MMVHTMINTMLNININRTWIGTNEDGMQVMDISNKYWNNYEIWTLKSLEIYLILRNAFDS